MTINRRALIIYCDNTPSDPLVGPVQDNINLRCFLQKNIGGDWNPDEIISIQNPTIERVRREIAAMRGVDYAFIVFTGHGYVNPDHNNLQYLELRNGDISVLELRTSARRQTIIIDACRGYYTEGGNLLEKAIQDEVLNFSGERLSTRKIFDDWVLGCEEGMVVLYAASVNESSLDTDDGAAYLISILDIAYEWQVNNTEHNILPLNIAHERAIPFMLANYETDQSPTIRGQKRYKFFPFAVKHTNLHS